MRTEGTKSTGPILGRWFAGLVAIAVTAALGGCGFEEAGPGNPSPKPPVTTPAPSAPQEPSTPPPPVHDEFVALCVDYTLFSAYLGDAESAARWNQAEQDEAKLRVDCETIAEEGLATRAGLEQSKAELDAFFAPAEAEEKRQARELSQAQAEDNRKLREFYEAAARAEEQRMVDEYLRAVEASNAEQEREAERQGDQLLDRLCGNPGGWYWYEINPVRVWLDRCNFSSGGGGGGGGGDLDCEDIGYEHEIDAWDDPHNLDGDGDGIACEGW